MQAAIRANLRMRLPGGEKIQAAAKSGFDNCELRDVTPATRQIIATEEHMPRFLDCTVHRMVNIAEARGIERTIPKLHRRWPDTWS